MESKKTHTADNDDPFTIVVGIENCRWLNGD